MREVEEILTAAEKGDAEAAAALLPLIYDELRSLAASRLAQERPGQSLSATALVHEAYLRLVGDKTPHFDGRSHFFAAAAQAMRRVLIDRARAKGREKRGSGRARIDVNLAELSVDTVPDELVALDEALIRLAAEDKVKAELVELRFFAGMTLREAAAVLGISIASADRYWAYSRAWLFDALRHDG
ncbi:MAG: sigma-70 family RNA polymerase sigma factor [Phycisphaerales bacterium]|nr:sigma-70 family RNA polymerase sigma factor [Phycisphaerales bacterium]MCB9864291.1 sigma-70 family RNA polymerase sigma factor [Phycisphaerales bacterium]